jgi:uncharacterized protein (TIGR03435 family)
MTLRALVSAAYDIRSERIVGLPPWAASELFEVEARSPFPDTTDQQNWAMLRALLSERFNLAVHEDVRERPIYALVRAGSGDRLGPRIKPSVDCRWAGRVGAASILASGDEYRCGLSTFSDINGTRIRAGARPISDLARTLDGTGGRPVLDRAGLLGTYNFELQFAAPRPPLALADVTSLPDVFTALEEQLGLKLEPQLGPVRFLVVERAEPPSDN